MNTFESSATPAAPGAMPTTPFRLVFPHGVANLTIRADASMSGNYRGEFYGPKPRVTEADGVVAIDYSQFNPFVWGRTSADVRLSPSVRWVIEIRGGVSHWDGDLRELDVAGIEVRGGVNKVDLRLARPSETVLVRVSGGVNRLTLRRPGTVPARVQIGGGGGVAGGDDARAHRNRRRGDRQHGRHERIYDRIAPRSRSHPVNATATLDTRPGVVEHPRGGIPHGRASNRRHRGARRIGRAGSATGL